jgi:hypothetical protein
MTVLTRALGGAATAALVGLWWTTALLGQGVAPPGSPAAPTPKTAAAPSPPAVKMLTNWHVSYEDAGLGRVEGRALVDWEKGSATVTLDDSSANRKVILRADDVKIDATNTQVTMRLRGASPGGARVKPPSTEGMQRVPAAAGQQLNIQPTAPSFSATILDQQRADADGVRLAFRAANFGALQGEWSYRADPITKRDGSGSGRTGYFRLLNEDELEDPLEGFIGEQSGREEWWPLPPEIACTAVMEEQLAAKNTLAEYPYPYSGVSTTPDEKLTTRTLFVLGRNFPVDRGRALEPIRWDDSDNIKNYRIVALSTDPNLDANRKQQIEDGWKKVLPLVDDAMKQVARSTLDAAVIVVEMKPGILPGPKKFGWGDGTGVWFLQFGDNIAETRFVRPIRMATKDGGTQDEVERTPYIFLPETLAVEVETHDLLPLEEIPVRIASISAPGSFITKPAKRIAPGKLVYRTKPFSVSNGNAFSSNEVAIRPSDKLIATVQMDDVAFIAPPAASAVALLTPDQVSQPSGSPAKNAAQRSSLDVKLWKEALTFAAKADKLAAGQDFSTLAGQPLTPYRGIPVTVADHAAMLLLRSEFLTMMREQQEYLNGIKSDDDVDAFREWIRPLMMDKGTAVAAEDPPVGWEKYPDYLRTIEDINNLRQWLLSRPVVGVKKAVDYLNGRPSAGFGTGTYFGELPVPGPGGGTWAYFTTYWLDRDAALDQFFHGDSVKLRAWRLQAVRAMLTHYRQAVETTITSVKAISDSDIKSLVKLTGFGFGPVVARVLPQLMKLDDSNATATPRWVPDLPARGAVGNLYVFAAAARQAEDYSTAKELAGLEIASAALASGAPGLLFSEATAEFITRAASYGILAWQSGEEIYDQVVVRSDIDQLLGAAGVLGVDRLDEARARRLTIGDVVEQLATQFGVGAVWGKITDQTNPLPAPIPKRTLLRLPFEIETAFAADAPLTRLQRLRSFATRIVYGLGAVSAENTVSRLRGLSLETLKQWPKVQLQRFLQLAGRGGARIELGQAASLEQVEAASQARRLKREADHADAPAPELTIAFGGPAPDLKPPEAGKNGLPGVPIQAGRLQPPAAAPRYPAAVAATRELPLTAAPARDKAWIAVKESTGETVYYKSTGVNEKGEPLKLGEGASSNVYVLTDIRERPKNNLLVGDGSVLKILRDDPKYGTAREQILRVKEAYQELEAAKERNPGLEYATIHEFHEDADPPYLIQRRINFDGSEYRQIKAADLMSGVLRPGKNIPPSGLRLGMQQIDQRFPRELRKAVVVLFFSLAAQQLISPDMSLANIYFRNVAGTWVAGILDIDHIVHIKKPSDNATWKWIREIHDEPETYIPSTALDGRELKTSFDFMEKALELTYGGNLENPWIAFNEERGAQVPGLIEPELVDEVRSQFFTWPRQGGPTK